MNSYREILRTCFPNHPPNQGRVGRSAETYLRELGQQHVKAIEATLGHALRQLDRREVLKICCALDVDVLAAYAVAMAWGGQNMRHFRMSVGPTSATVLRNLLESLRVGHTMRKDDFARVQQECRYIPGLGISFYTKLLFFFRAESNSYILDQWTAKSAHLLFEPPPVGLSTFGLPDPDTSPESYESFCADLERLGSPWGWTGEDVERAIFDRRGGCWRSQVQSAFPDLPRGVRSQRQRQVSIQVGKSSRQYLLGNKIIAVHHSALQDEVTLPGDELCIGDYSPYRIVCSSVGGISWQYNIQKSCVRVDVFFPKQYVPRYDAIRKAAGIQGHDFGDGIVGNGADQGKTRSIATMVDRGANAHDSELKSIAEASVEAMNRLYERIAPLL